MQDKHLFEYAVIRVVPRVEREEFMNAGVVLYCAKQRFLKALYLVDEKRLGAFACKTDLQELTMNLEAFASICDGNPNSGPIGKLDAASRFRWLTATRSTVLQTSKVHPGFCTNAAETLHKLFTDLIE